MSFGKRWINLNPYELHKTLINEYFLIDKSRTSLLKRDTSKDKRDIDVIKENHQFLWEDDQGSTNLTWEKKLAKKYYDKLFKEYCVGDLSKYKENKIGLRWRTEKELIDGKGQFSCGNKICSDRENLRTWEVNFGYVEHGVKKNALVKLRLCPECSHKLNYHHKKKEVKRLKTHKHSVKEEPSQRQRAKKDDNENNDVTQKSETQVESNKNIEEASESNIWKQAPTEDEDNAKSREEEFDEYLDQLFL